MNDCSPKDNSKKESSEKRVNSVDIQLISSLTGEISYEDAGGAATTVSDLVYRSVGELGDSTLSFSGNIQAEEPNPPPLPPMDESQSPGAFRVRGIDWHESIDYDDEVQNDDDNNSSSSSTFIDETILRNSNEPVASAMLIEDSFVAIATELTDEDSILDGRTNDSKFGIVPFRSRSIRLFVAIAVGLILCLAIVAGVMVGIKSGDNGSQTSPAPSTNIPVTTHTRSPLPTISPTSTNPSQSPQSSILPTLTPLVRAEMITNFTISISGEEVLQNGTAQQKALSWILDEDPQHLSASDPRLLQRYVASLLYFQLDGENWLDAAGYLTGANECDWFGITCGKRPNTKWAIENITVIKNLLKGELPEEVIKLPELRILDLRTNLLHGTIPTGIGNMKKLLALNLNQNLLTGGIPSIIGNMTNIRQLALCCNLLTGTIPSTIGGIEKVITIAFDQNVLKGTIPPELSNLANLEYFSVRDNFLTGTIPSRLGNLSTLTELHLYDNKFNGTISSYLGNLRDLKILYLKGNELVGTGPQSVCELRQGQLDELEVNCGKVKCSCCTNCDDI